MKIKLKFRLLRELLTMMNLAILSNVGWSSPEGPPLFHRQVLSEHTVVKWSFADSACGWGSPQNAVLHVGPQALQVRAAPPVPEDPHFWSPPLDAKGPLRVRLRMRCDLPLKGQIFWVTKQNPAANEQMSALFDLSLDTADWHDYDVMLPTMDTVTGIRLDPVNGDGNSEIQWMEVSEVQYHPLQLVSLETEADQIHLHLQNYAETNLEVMVNGSAHSMGPRKTESIAVPVEGNAPLQTVPLRIESRGLPSLAHSVFLYRPDAPSGSTLAIASEALTLRAASDGSWARLERGGKNVAALAPLVNFDGRLPSLKQGKSSAHELRFSGDGVEACLSLQGEELAVRIRSAQPCEGPVVRAFGPLEQGLFAGLEYLGKKETSSSTLDIETEEHWRYAPDPLKVTMPLMAVVTDQAAVAMTWKDMSLQPVFASPNFADGSADHRMALRGRNIEATVRISEPQPMEELILWGVRQRGGLPPLPSSPRDSKGQQELELRALNGPLHDENGWGHCIEASWPRKPYSDQASTLFRLTGKVPELPKLERGGAHFRNDSVYFVTNRVQEWLEVCRAEVKSLISDQQTDGSFRYQGKYQRGHFENTASGYCASKAATLLEFARLTGDAPAREAGLRVLEFMKRFRTPRGAQTWEVPLHTPDILASAYLVQSYVRGYELTGNAEYLHKARQWALSGVPFVYQWWDHRLPIMPYTTIAVYGATNWRAPVWFGLPVQWCGLVYAHALMQLSPYDQTLDWSHLAHGILIAGQQLQYPEGEKAGCFPDVFRLDDQIRDGPSINPSNLVSLELEMAGQVDSLAVAKEGTHHIVAPFPVRLEKGVAHVQAPRGLHYQVLVDGQRVVTVDSKGEDEVEIASTEGKK